MKKSIIAGILICAFILMSLPSINALEGKTLISKEKDSFKATKISEFFSMAKDLENKVVSQGIFKSSILLGTIVVGIIILILIYIYISGFIAPDPVDVPTITFVKDETSDTLTVSTTDTNVLWSDIEIQGQCNTEGLSLYVTAGDQITECNGEIRIIHAPTNALLGVFTFN